MSKSDCKTLVETDDGMNGERILTPGKAERRVHAVQEALETIPTCRRASVVARAEDCPESVRLGYVRAAADGELTPMESRDA